MPGPSKWSLRFRFCDQTYISPCSPVCYMLCLPHSLDLIHTIISGKYILCSTSLCSFLKPACYFLPLGSKYSPHIILKHRQSMFFLQFFRLIENKMVQFIVRILQSSCFYLYLVEFLKYIGAVLLLCLLFRAEMNLHVSSILSVIWIFFNFK
jgi:hypothetical protein